MLVHQDVESKQPEEIKVYIGDWRVRLYPYPGIIIVGSTWTVISPDNVLTITGSGIGPDGLTTCATFHGGTPGVAYTIRNAVTLIDGQQWRGYGLLRVDAEATLLAS